MPTDTPDTSRAALEALAADAENWLRYWGWPNEPLAATTSPEGDLLASIAKYAPALRALASRAEPPADVARLVEEAKMLAEEADNRDACEAVPGGFDARVAATLRALAARVVELEAEVERLNDQLVAQAMVGPPAATIETGEPCTLVECPIGLFYHDDDLCLKTEYGNNEGRIDAFIVSSGEFFWGHEPQTIASQRASIVTPAYASPTARAALETPNAD